MLCYYFYSSGNGTAVFIFCIRRLICFELRPNGIRGSSKLCFRVYNVYRNFIVITYAHTLNF